MSKKRVRPPKKQTATKRGSDNTRKDLHPPPNRNTSTRGDIVPSVVESTSSVTPEYTTTPRDEVQDGESDDEVELEYQPHTEYYCVLRSDVVDYDFHFDQKARNMVDITNADNKLTCHYPSSRLTVHEQINLFQGRSEEKYKIYNIS